VNIGNAPLRVCFGVECLVSPEQTPDEYEHEYQSVYKTLISSLYSTPELPFTLYLSGLFLEWIAHAHAEFFMILNELIGRKQIEILGGGYYSPLYPLLPLTDRVGQTELLTTELRRHFNKRPRGAWLDSSAWEPSMVSTLNTCGIEYILLDKLMLETSGFPGIDGLTPVTVEDSGKTIIALPLDNRFRDPTRYEAEAFFREITAIGKVSSDRSLIVFLDRKAIPSLFEPGEGGASWFSAFLSQVAADPQKVELTTTGRLVKARTLYPRAYITSGMSPYSFEDAAVPDDVRILARTSSKHVLVKSLAVFNLYAKMMYVHILVNQLRGDKSRKKNAREELWHAQTGEVYCARDARSDNDRLRAIAYKSLLVAERQTRVRGHFTPSIVTFDFDMDGLKEFLCQHDDLNFYVHSVGGRIFELDVFNAYRNYCDVALPCPGLFIDHFVSAEDIELVKRGALPASPPVFADSIYQDTAIDTARHDLFLKTSGFFDGFQQPLSLKKQYSFRNEGIQVQYILKNDSPLNLSGIFMIELDLALVAHRGIRPTIAVYANETKQDSPVELTSFQDVSWIRFDDAGMGVRFTLDANENPSVTVQPIAEGLHGSPGTRVFLYWKVELGPNFETEKMVFLKIDS